jgi:F-type H+-transporting ATPase subunit delta
MSQGVVAKRYARALFELANDKNMLDQVEAELTSINEAIDSSLDFQQFLTHPQIDAAVKKEKLNAIFAESVSESVLSFLFILVERRREGIISSVLQDYVSLANEARGISEATVTSAYTLGEEELGQVAEDFGKKIGKKLRVKNVVDPTILGGVVIRIGDRLYDGSIAGQLSRFKHSLVKS